MGTEGEGPADGADGAESDAGTPPDSATASNARATSNGDTQSGADSTPVDTSRLDRTLAVLAAPDEHEPGTEAHRRAADDVARSVTTHRERVAERVDVLVGAFEHTVDDERARATPENTAERRKQRLGESRESIVDALSAPAGSDRARRTVIPTVQRWLADGDETLLRAGLVVGWALLDDGVHPTVHAAFASALELVLSGEHPGYQRVSESVSQDPVQVVVPSESRPVRVSVASEDVSDSELLTELWRFARHLSAAAAEALETCDEDAVEYALACQGHLHGATAAVLMNATAVLKTAAKRDLYEHGPPILGNLAATVLIAYDDPRREPYASYDEPRALEGALATLVKANRQSERRLVPPFDRIASVAAEHPDRLSDHVVWVVRTAGVTKRTGEVEATFEALLAVADEDPTSVAEYTPSIATALGPNRDSDVVETVATLFARIAPNHPDAVEPHVDTLVESFAAVDDGSEGEFYARTAIVMAALAPTYPETVLRHEQAVLDALDRADEDLLTDEQGERLQQLFGPAVDTVLDGDATPDRTLDVVEEHADTTDRSDVSVEECIAAVSAALDEGADSGERTNKERDSTLEESETPGEDDRSVTPREALERLFEVQTDRPRAVEPYRSTLLAAVEQFDASERVAPALAVLSRLANANSRALAGELDPVVEVLRTVDEPTVVNNALFTLRNTADKAPDAVTPHVEHVADIIDATDNVDHTYRALQTLVNVSKEHPDAVAPRLATVAEMVEASDDRELVPALVTCYYVAKEEPGAVSDHTGVLVDVVDDGDPDEISGSAAEILGYVAQDRPAVVISHLDRFASILRSTDDWRVAREAAVAINTATRKRSVEPALEYIDLVADRLAEYVREREDSTSEDGSGDQETAGTKGDENGIDLLLFGSLAVLNRAGDVDVDRIEPHVPTIVAALTQCDDVRTARAACFSLVTISESYPETVGPHIEAIVRTIERFSDADLTYAIFYNIYDNYPADSDAADNLVNSRSQNPEDFEILQSLISNEQSIAGLTNGLVSMISGDVQKLVTGPWLPEMVSGYVNELRENPDIADKLDAAEHAETMVEITGAAEDPAVAESAAEALYLLARLRTIAVAAHTDEIADLLDETGLPQDDETVTGYVLTALTNVAGEEAAAVVDRVDTVADAVDPPAAAATATVETGVYVLSRLTPWPARLAPHFDLLVESLSHVDNSSAVDNGICAVMSVAGPEDEVNVRPHTDAVGEAVGRLDDWTEPVGRLRGTQRKYPELKLAVVEVLAAALAERETVEPAQADPFRTALVETADGIEPPVAAARTCDLLGQIGSPAPPHNDEGDA